MGVYMWGVNKQTKNTTASSLWEASVWIQKYQEASELKHQHGEQKLSDEPNQIQLQTAFTGAGGETGLFRCRKM